jgi:hypothetical protein
VRLERVKAVRAKYDRFSSGRQQTMRLLQRRKIVGHVLQHLMEEDDIEGAVRERQVLSDGEREAGHLLAALYDPLLIDVDAGDLRGELTEAPENAPTPQPMSRCAISRSTWRSMISMAPPARASTRPVARWRLVR